MKKLRAYQEHGIRSVFSSFKKGNRKVVYQLATGGGKTYTATELIHFFLKSNPSAEALFLVHRVELLTQFKDTFESAHPEFEVGIIDAQSKMKRFDLRLNVGMIETSIRRLSKDKIFFGNKTRLLIVDECHNSSFDKIFQFFPNALVIGLTATPMRLSNTSPMNLVYNDIVIGPSISQLIEEGSLAPNKTFIIDNGTKSMNLKKRAGEYTTQSIFDEYSKAKHITNVVRAYEMKSLGKKTIVFNASVEHSELVDRAFKTAGYNSRHLDGATNKTERENILKWFSRTPDAILQNVGVLTMGFDEPSINTVIMNRPTASLPLWLQCCGRGSRNYPGKTHFNIIDLGGNAERLNDWSFDHDWGSIFKNAVQKINDGEGIAPIKSCEECGYIMPIQTITCPECGHTKVQEIEEDTKEIELKLLTDNFSKKINVYKIDNFVKKRNWKDYAGLHIIKDELIREMKLQGLTIESNEFKALYRVYLISVEEWCALNGKDFDDWHRDYAFFIVRKSLNVKRKEKTLQKS